MKKIRSGFENLDKQLGGGFQPGELIVVAARPTMGKTQFMLEMALHMSSENIPVGLFSLDMCTPKLEERLVKFMSGVSAWKMSTPLITPFEANKYKSAEITLGKLPLFLDDSKGMSIDALVCQVRTLVCNSGVKVIMVDYVQLMTVEHESTFLEKASSVVSVMKGLAEDLGIVIIVTSQLCHQMGNGQLDDLYDTLGSATQHVDKVLIFQRPDILEYYQAKQKENILEGLLIFVSNPNDGKFVVATF